MHTFAFLLPVVSIGLDQGIVEYNLTECLESAIWIPIRLTGLKAPDRHCEVSVRTEEGSALGDCGIVSLGWM